MYFPAKFDSHLIDYKYIAIVHEEELFFTIMASTNKTRVGVARLNILLCLQTKIPREFDKKFRIVSWPRFVSKHTTSI